MSDKILIFGRLDKTDAYHIKRQSIISIFFDGYDGEAI